VEARELRANTAASRGCDAAWKGEQHVHTNGCPILDILENNSRTAKGAKLIGQDNEALSVIMLPLRNRLNRDQDVLTSIQSLKILSNLVVAGAINSTGVLNEIYRELTGFTAHLLDIKTSGYIDLLVKCFSLIKKLDYCGSEHWVTILELYMKVSSCTDAEVLFESIACITAIVSRVTQGLKASQVTKHADVSINGLKEILDHAKTAGVTDTLLSQLVTCGTSLMSGSSYLLRAACEACKAIWSFIDAYEIQSTRETTHVFPLSSMHYPSLDRLNIKGDESAKIVESVARVFLRSKAVQIAFYHCLRQRLEAAWSSVIQIILRCCLHNNSVTGVLCTTVVGDNTIISEIFSLLSLCASFDRGQQTGDTNNLKSKLANPCALVCHSCLLLAAVAQSLKSTGRNSELFMLTSSPNKQRSRLSDLAHHYSLCDRIHNSFQPHSMSAMLAFASILSLESNPSVETSIPEIAVPLIPPSATLCDYLRISIDDGNGSKLSCWHGLRDGCVGLLDARLKWGGPLAIQQLCASGIPQTLIDLLGNADDKDMVRAIEASMGKYLQILLEVGIPGQTIQCLRHVELKDAARLVAFLAKMTGHRSLVVQLLGKGLLNPNIMRRLLDNSSPREVILDVLSIVSDLARMDKGFEWAEGISKKPNQSNWVGSSIMMGHDLDKGIGQNFYEHIKGADILELLKIFLAHEDPNVRAKACSAIGNMCRHSSYFYGLLAKHNIIPLLVDRCSDEDKRTRKFSCFAIGNAAYHNDFFYEELRRCIPQLAKLLLSAEEDKTKANASGALSNLVRNSNKLCDDIVSKGAMQALMKLVADYSVVALNPSRRDAINESPLKIALFSLAKMCAHSPCRQFLRSSALYPVIGRLRQSPEATIANYATVIYNKTCDA
ncbi:serine/threonine-protein kinase TIO, partial [Tanacetum coccineum]